MTDIMLKAGYFTKEDMTCRCGCGRFSMDTNFMFRLLGFRVDFGKPLYVNCGGRCKKHNKDVGGVPTSLHECETKQACAADVTAGTPAQNKELYKAACVSGLFNEVEWHKTDGQNFVHLGWDKKQVGNDFKII